MRKMAAFILLCIYVLIQAASVCWYFYKPLAHAYFIEKSKENTEDRDLISITIDHDKLASLKNEEGEIIIDGVLYDIENAVSSGNKIELLLKKDSEETDWDIEYKKIANVLQKNKGGGYSNLAKASFSILSLYYCSETTTNLYLVKPLPKPLQRVSARFYPWPVKEMVTPPPKFC